LSSNKTLTELGLVPTAVVHFGLKDTSLKPKVFLKDQLLDTIKNVVDSTVATPSLPKEEKDNSKTQSQNSTKKGLPKWFSIGKKK